MKTQIKVALRFLLAMTLLTGIIYPLLLTGIAQLGYRSKANGSLIMMDNKIIGSKLIGQNFDSSIYFWSRPSAIGYNPIPSGGSNFGPTSDKLKNLVGERRKYFAQANSLKDSMLVPNVMLFASGSGLDPHISPEAALMQVDRISLARHFDNSQKEQLLNKVKEFTEAPQFLCLGELRINVLMLNLELDKI